MKIPCRNDHDLLQAVKGASAGDRLPEAARSETRMDARSTGNLVRNGIPGLLEVSLGDWMLHKLLKDPTTPDLSIWLWEAWFQGLEFKTEIQSSNKGFHYSDLTTTERIL